MDKKEYLNRNMPPPLAEYPPLIINVCLTGMIPDKDMTEFVPISPEEIAEDAIRCCDAGASIVHLHARGDDGKPTWKAEIYEKMINLIRKERPELICCTSTSGRTWSEFEKRSEVLRLTGSAKPDMGSLTLGSLNFPTGPSLNAIEMVSDLAATMRDNGIKPELEVFDAGMINLGKILESKGIIQGKKYWNLLFGSMNSTPADTKSINYLVSLLPENSVWSAAGIGQFQLPMNAAAIIMGGNVRVGIEDNIFYDYEKKKLATNLDLVERLRRIADEIYRPVATPAEARKILNLELTPEASILDLVSDRVEKKARV